LQLEPRIALVLGLVDMAAAAAAGGKKPALRIEWIVEHGHLAHPIVDARGPARRGVNELAMGVPTMPLSTAAILVAIFARNCMQAAAQPPSSWASA
jgi:hypothetical protein